MMRQAAWGILSIAAAFTLGACETPVRTTALPSDFKLVSPTPEGYRFNGQVGKTLVIATFSGGGTRAATLAAGALQAFVKTPSHLDTGTATLDREIDVISSISGGSVTAAQFGLFGADGLPALRDEFLYQDIMGDAIGRALNPAFLLTLPTPMTARIDVMVSIFKDRLFSRDGVPLTYADMMRRSGPKPFVMLGATDMAATTQFVFTQDWFNLICADLSKFTVAEAVAASSAFPVALSPVTLKNFSGPGCAPQAAAGSDWPLEISNALADPPYINPERHRRATVRKRYLNREGEAVNFVHLLDGGIADNVGLVEPLFMVANPNADGALSDQLLNGDITDIVFLMVNARSEVFPDLSETDATPGMVDMLMASVNGGIDGATFSRISRMRETLRDTIVRDIEDEIAFLETCGEENRRACPAGRDAGLASAIETRYHVRRQLRTYFIPVDFDFIEDKGCRDRLKPIATSWSLEKQEIDLLLRVGEAMVYRAPDYAAMVEAGMIDAPSPVAAAWKSGNPKALIDTACAVAE